MRKTDEQAVEQPKPKRRRAPARTLEGREQQIIAKSYDAIEKLIDEGKASSQLLTEFARRGSTKERLEKQLLEQKIELDRAKIEDIKTRANMESLAADAIEAMRTYTTGSSDGES